MSIVRSLHLLEVATVRDNGVPVPVFLIHLADGRWWLVDTGCPADMIGDPDAPFVVTGESHVLGRLDRLGLGPADIDTVIVSHLDPDHCGANDEFPHARFVVQRAQHEHATRSGLPRYEWLRSHWDLPNPRLVDGDTRLVPGVTLVECSGHVPGHQAVLVELPDTGPVLLAGDAWMRGTDPETRPLTQHDLDEPAVRASQRKLMDIEGVALVVHNHDTEQWRTLRHAPARYT
ncbi:N-acyl homoserine lactonase family protein [Actinophytocola sp.]|uniref:N-acyl homoserine lactonase family protein n=1 Tax=Actinophytocola sp. TaxID=1872138 RepID=UPI003899B30D